MEEFIDKIAAKFFCFLRGGNNETFRQDTEMRKNLAGKGSIIQPVNCAVSGHNRPCYCSLRITVIVPLKVPTKTTYKILMSSGKVDHFLVSE